MKIFSFLILLTSCIAFASGQSGAGQEKNFSVEPKKKQVFINSRNTHPRPLPRKADKDDLVIDSLNDVVETMNASLDLRNQQLRSRDSLISALDRQLSDANKKISQLESNVASVKGQNLKLDQSNRILIIFNSVVGILLLATLIWFIRNLGRKKPVRPNASSGVSLSDVQVNRNGISAVQQVGQKLEHLERLSKLREKGLLSDEEFNQQKKKLLGDTY